MIKTFIDRFVAYKKIGKGSYGVVFSGMDKQTMKLCAIKVERKDKS